MLYASAFVCLCLRDCIPIKKKIDFLVSLQTRMEKVLVKHLLIFDMMTLLRLGVNIEGEVF